MSISAVKELQSLFGQFEHSYFEKPDDVDVVLHRVMAVAGCLDRLRIEGNIGAYIGGMDSIDRFYREAPERTIMEDARDPAIMKAIAENLPVHTVSGLNFFMSSTDDVMMSAISSYASHMQVRSAYTLKNDAASVASRMAARGMEKSVDSFLGLMEEISRHDPQIMSKSDFTSTLCCTFEGVLEAERAFVPGRKLRSLVYEYLVKNRVGFEISYPRIESAMGLAKARYPDVANAIAKAVFPRSLHLNDRTILRMETLGMDVQAILRRVAQQPTSGWVYAYFAYRLLTDRNDLDIPSLDLTDITIKGAAKRMLMEICADDGFNQTYAQQLMGEFGRLYPNEGKDFLENQKVKQLALTVDRYRESAMGVDLGL
ncbi:hypothetical protein [Pseudomonas amygdali]|uniref:Uncharacterized protein n=2 Tax=Pseudomonas amygdali pv. lachrymans TaxID=53707 RepID=A0ABR5KS34_PSEAV|nr:hypothetical protein [Pseudomonas amygdali]AXH59979.1 hypothetical protein PLA107_032655 [Pseudomonas amygdali pv. lachrymans str. M301315]KPC17382.1 Uncharacterized protein AC499_0584 [Pseudomonas amygdali pv. lachrymans]RMT05704.1 hypothetical protein ALP54_03836 [Pseudomonas amygdali pv. lachrymans]